MNISNISRRIHGSKIALVFAFYFLTLVYSDTAVSQSTPVVTVRFANPSYNCADSTYCLDVEFLADTSGIQVFGMNIRFFYEDSYLELDTIADYQGGYEPVSPIPPMIVTGMGGFLNFSGNADWVNAAMQLKNTMLPAIILDTVNWTKLFQVCFKIDGPIPNFQNFCPPVVWDLQMNPANGGYLGGDDGVVITVVDPTMMMESIPSDENVVQFNWVYTVGTPYFGTPQPTNCISLDCSPMLMCAVDTTVECNQTDPNITGFATATDICAGDPVITYSDSIVPGNCPNDFILIRTWYAANGCNLHDTCVQIITVIDITAPTIVCPNDVTLECASDVPAPNPGGVTASDNCSGPTIVTFLGDFISNSTCVNRFTITRTYRATDGCGNSASCNQTIDVFDDIPPAITCPTDITVQCASQVPPANTSSVTTSDNCGGQANVSFIQDVISNQTCINHFTVSRTYQSTDLCGNSATCIQTIIVSDDTPPFILCPGNVTVQCASLVPQPNTASVIASDNCNGLATVTFVNDVIFNQTCTNRFNVTRTYRATDDCGNSATCSQTITVFDNTAPSIQCPGNITVQCASLVPQPNIALVIASDNCNSQATVTFVNDVISNQTCTNRFNVTRTYRATDECGNSASCSQIITVFDNTAPSIQCPGNVTVQCASLVPQPNTTLVIASDNCNGQATVTFVNDVISNQTCTNRFNVTRTYRATDECGNSASCSQIITVFDNTAPTITCPGNVTVQCASLVPQPNTALVITSDNCNGLATITFVNDVISNQTCTNRFNVTRTYRATDECGNSATCSQTITVFDNIVPSIQCPGNVTVQCASLVPQPNTALVIASDNCNGLATVTFVNDVISNQTCTNRFNVTRTYRATDECGNSATCSQTITVFDNIVPSIQCPGNVTVQCASLVPQPNTASVIASDNCNGLATVTFVNDVITNQTCTNRFNVTRTYRATDECGNSATCSQTITVFDNIAPSIQCPGNVTVQCASLVPQPNTSSVIASDNCNGLATVTFVNDVISNQTCTNRFNVTRTYRATDECGNSASCSQTITVFDNTEPSIQCPGNVTVQCGSLVPQPNTASVIASDNCNGLATVTFVNDVISNQTCTNRFNVTRTYRATDECGNSATCSQTITVFDNIAPSIQCPGNVTVQCASLVPQPNTASVITSDNCNGLATVTFVNDVISNQTCTNRFNVTRTYRATDECGNSATCSQTITVFDDTVPSIQCPGNVTVQCASLVPQPNTANVIASDNCNGLATVTFVNDVISNQTCTNRFNVTRTYRATDECGNSATCSQTITVFDNTVPSIQCPGNITVQCASLVPAPNTALVIASDNCNGLATITFVNDVISNQTCTNRFNVTRTYRATDECGNSASCSQSITVFDNTAPSIQCPGNVTVQCASLVPQPNTALVIASDNCNGLATVTFVNDVISNQTCTNRFTVTRTYRATDECGNSATCSQTITVFDNTVPTIQCPGNITVQCASLVPAPNTASVIASDNCNGLATVTFVNDVISNQTCTNRFNVTRTYRATDECGNSATCSQTITVFDNTVPSIQCPGNVTVQCASLVPAPNTTSVIASDNCNGLATVTFVNDVISNQICTNRFTVTRTYRATDECGNSATCSQTITVFDNTLPTLTCPVNITVQCANQVPAVNTASVITADNCGGTPTVTVVGQDVISNQTCANRFTVTRTYRSTDACGNSATCAQIITVNDITPPVITCPANLTVAFGTSTIPATTGNPTGSDNCTGTPAFTFNDVIIPGNCPEDFIINRTWTATDACAMTATCVQSITVDGNCSVDLSLVKVLDPNQNSVQGGDNVNFTITVTNQGQGDVSSVTITDYIPLGFSLNDPDWTPGNAGSTGQSASIVLSIANGGLDANGLNPGESVSVQITLQADINIQPGQYFNSAEISVVLNLQGVDVSDQDIDSNADNDNTNDPPGEDDISQAAICVLPNPVIVGDPFVCPGQLVTYTVQNYNPAFTYNWTLNGGGTIVTNTGETITVQWLSIPGAYQIQLDVIIAQGCQTTTFLNVVIEAFEVLACDDHIQISLDGDCEVVIVPSMILEGQLYGENYIVIILNENGDTIPNATLTYESVGHTFTVKIISECGINSCWGTITVEDKIPPHITCACPQEGSDDPACQITCLEIDQLVNGIIPNGLQPDVSDNCGQVNVEIAGIDVNYDNCAGGYVHVTWLASDLSGNTATCVEVFTVIPLTLESLVFPPNYIGECGTSPNPAITGWPQINGVNLTDAGGVCNIFAGYWDEELNQCGGGRKIIRTWTVLDWCTVEIVEYTQIIKLTDDQGPILTCPSDITVGTEFWYCYANVSVPKPQAYDVCSDVVDFSLYVNGGTITQFGNNFVINGLLIGTYTAVWTVADECGNSSTCSFHITVVDDVAPVANCDAHTIVSLTNDGPAGLTLVPATVFNDGSYDNCGPVTFRVRRMDSCIDFDWTTNGACVDDVPNGFVNGADQGTIRRTCVPFSCCDVGAGPVMVELEVTDAAGNVNYCMVEAIVQDKISPFVECPPDITVSCDFWFNVQEGTFVDGEGNHNGNLDEDPLTPVFGNMYDAFRYQENVRDQIVINDPGNNDYHQPHTWGIDGWADDNCEVNLQVRVKVFNDCTGDDLPPGAPAGAVKLIERRFSASDGNQGIAPGVCTQRIWVVNFHPFYITDSNCNNSNPNDGVIWPCDVLLTTCPDSISGTGEPILFDNACSLIGVAYEDTRFEFVEEGACFKILRQWSVIDWCQYNSQTGEGLWSYTQVIKVHDNVGPAFVNCPAGPVTLCVADDGVSLPDNNQAFLGEENPQSSSCSVHLNLCQQVRETCSDVVHYDVKLYLFNADEFIYLQPLTTAPVDSNGIANLCFNTRNNSSQAIRNNGIPYNSPFCGDYHKILWSAEDGCGNWSHCEYLIRLEDCKQPSPVCINGLSTVVMPIGGQVTIWAKDFNASSFDDCTPAADLLYSFSGDAYQPSFTYTCDNVPAFGVELSLNIWVADGGTDDNCNGQISWTERNKDYCSTTIVITDNANVCDTTGSVLAGQILTDHGVPVGQVKVTLTSPGQVFPAYVTAADGHYRFDHLLSGTNYTITPERDDNHKNGVSTLDLVRIQKHLLGLQDFTSPYQFIAADANHSSSVSAIDLVELRKLILGIYTELPSSESWTFVDKKYAMPNPAHPWPYVGSIDIEALQGRILDNDFIGVKVGDVNNSVQANATQVLPRDARKVMNIKVASPESVENGELIEMKLTFPSEVSGFQWTLETDGLEYVGLSSDDISIGDDNIGLLGNGIVTMSWNGVQSNHSANVGPSIIMKWKATAPGKLSKMIRMTSHVTPAESYTVTDEIMDVKLSYLNDQVKAEFGLYQNKPNPWNGQTLIGFDLPKDDHARLTIFDVAGKNLKTIEGDYKAGYNSIELTEKDIPASGVLYYRLESGENSASKKMIILR